MPQVAGHLLVAERVKGSLGNPPYIQNNQEAFNLGAVGPDLALFLFDPGGPVSSVLNFAIRFYTVIRDIQKFIDETAGKVTEPLEDLTDWLTGGLSTSLGGLITYSFDAITQCFAITLLPGSEVKIENPFVDAEYPGIPNGPTLVIKSSDLSLALRFFGHPYSQDPPYKSQAPHMDYRKDWWWVDLLHYRRTGPLAQRLFQYAQSDQQRAYAAGYWTHIAADVCGHPYVNTVVGGPFRNHVIRHMVMENIIDTWLWNKYKGAELLSAGLDQYINVNGFVDIAAYLNQQLNRIFINPQPGRRQLRPENFSDHLPSTEDWERAFETLRIFLEMSTNSYLAPPIPPPGSPGELLEEILDSVKKTAQKLKKSFNPTGWSWWEWLLAPFVLALHALTLIVKLVTLPAQVLIRIATLAPRWFIYYLQLAFYEYIVNARWMLVLSGWGKASRDDLSRVFAKMCYHLPGDRVGPVGSYVYPFKQLPRVDGFWLIDPRWMKILDPVWWSGCEEGPFRTEASPYPKYATPDVFIDGPSYHDPMDGVLRAFAAPPHSPSVTVNLEAESYGTPQFGNAVEFAKRLINGTYPAACFDLDGDRGYGYVGWEGAPPSHTPGYPSDLF